MGCVIFDVISVLEWVQNTFVVIVNNLFSLIRVTVADFYGITVEYFSELVVSREVLVYTSVRSL